MITINLLPQEMRKRERTPIVVFLPIIIGLVCVLSAGAVTAWVRFAWRTEVESEKARIENDVRQMNPRLRYEEALLREEGLYKKRADTIKDIAKSRVLMTRKLDEVCDVIQDGADTSSYLIWLTELKTAPPKAQRARRGAKVAKPGGTLQMRGYALADFDPLHNYNQFHAAIKNSDMYHEFMTMNNPQGSIKHFNDDMLPKKGWTVDLTLTMRHPEEVAKERAKAMEQQAIADRKKKNSGARKSRSGR